MHTHYYSTCNINQHNTLSQSAHTDYNKASSQLAKQIPYAIVRNSIYRILEYRIITYRITTLPLDAANRSPERG
jgi:hypothetical protein